MRLAPTNPFTTSCTTPGSIAVAGAGFSWLEKNLGLLGGAHEVDAVASQVWLFAGQQQGAHTDPCVTHQALW